MSSSSRDSVVCRTDSKPLDGVSSCSAARNFQGLEASEPMNILLLGPTGVGKSSFINSFYNYLSYETVEDALSGGVKVAVPSKFTVFNKTTRFHEDVLIGDNGLGEENLGDDGESSTLHAKAHVFLLSCTDGEQKVIRIIDTPGVADTRGIEEDKENLRSILSTVSSLTHLHGILIVLKPNEARLNALLEYCITELLVQLHKNASKNVVFCFTNTLQTDYSVGETVKPLAKLLDTIRKKSGVDIPLNDSTMYCFENEPFRYLAARSTTKKPPNESWEMSRREWLRLISHLYSLLPHRVEETLSIERVKSILENLEEPLGFLTSSIEDNMRRLSKQRHAIQNGETSIEELKRNLKFMRKIVNVTKLDYSRFVCTSACCVDYVETTDGKKIVYKTICHARCNWEEWQDAESQAQSGCPFLGFKKWSCSAINLFGQCKQCGCWYDGHAFINYDIQESEVEEVNLDIAQSIADGQRASEIAKALLEDVDARGRQLEMEKMTIQQVSIRFAIFLRVNSITPTNAYTTKYWQSQIKAKRAMSDGTDHDNIEIRRMEEDLEKYQGKVHQITELLKQGCDTIDVNLGQLNLSSIMADIDSLYNLPLTGPTFLQAESVIAKSAVSTKSKLSREAVHLLPQEDRRITGSNIAGGSLSLLRAVEKLWA